jgi:hypothetical protein
MSTQRSLAVALLFVAACGGHSAKYKVDEVVLAQVPINEKQAVFDAQNEVTVAKSEKAKADADADVTGKEIRVAEAERDQAKLEVDKWKIERDMALKARDDNRSRAAVDRERVAELGKRAADAKVDTLGARRSWQRAMADQADAHIDSAVSRVELEKAKIAVAKGITPSKDFDAGRFAKDYESRVRRLDEARVNADKKREKLDRAVADHDLKRSEFDRAKATSMPTAPPASPPPPMN